MIQIVYKIIISQIEERIVNQIRQGRGVSQVNMVLTLCLHTATRIRFIINSALLQRAVSVINNTIGKDSFESIDINLRYVVTVGFLSQRCNVVG